MIIKHHAYCFTYFTSQQEAYDFSVKLFLAQVTKYVCLGFEKTKTGRFHIQGYIWFKVPLSNRLARQILKGAHFENAVGSPISNRDYCLKTKTGVQFGDLAGVNKLFCS